MWKLIYSVLVCVLSYLFPVSKVAAKDIFFNSELLELKAPKAGREYILKKKPRESAGSGPPFLQRVFVEELSSQTKQVLLSRELYRLWDITGDGYPDMLEAFAASGKVLFTVFDFDFDGVVDYQN